MAAYGRVSNGVSRTRHDGFHAHLLQLDHWTFLLALCLVSANVVVTSQYLSAIAALLLLVALVYDAVEFYAE